VLYSFSGGTDGSNPTGKLLRDATGNLYGTTEWGGSEGYGTIFELSPDASGKWTENTIYNFCQSFNGYSCLDGANPKAALIADSHGNLYGTTSLGGGFCAFESEGCGLAFELSPPSLPGGSWSYTQLYAFCQAGNNNCPDGALPYGTLTFSGSGDLVGTTTTGGANQVGGTVFQLAPSEGGWTETVLYSFCSQQVGENCVDGYGPESAVSFDSSGNLYGTTAAGGSSKYFGDGVVFKLSPSGDNWDETVLIAFFNGPKGGTPEGAVNFDAKGDLYSTVSGGGQAGWGGVFQLPRTGTKENIFSFDMTNGAIPLSGVLIDPRNNDLYGTTSAGGTNNLGTVFRIADGKETVLHNFVGIDGSTPSGALIADQYGHLYGTTADGGASSQGVVFEIMP